MATQKDTDQGDEQLRRGLILYEDYATADGAGDGSTIVCSRLTGQPDFDGNTVVITTGDYQQAHQIDGDTTGGTITVAANFDGQILAGTYFTITTVRSAPAAVADIQADVGDASSSTLGSIYNILGNPTESLTTKINNLQTDIDNLDTALGRVLCSMDFWSAPQEEVQVTSVAGDKGLPNVTLADLPSGATIVRAIAMFKFRMVENSHAGVNKLAGAQNIQVRADTPGTWRNAITLVDALFTLADSAREGGDVLLGGNDIAVEVDGNDIYEFQWASALADQDNLQFNDVQVGLRVWFSL